MGTECLRVLKPGGYLASFGSPRTVHRLASGIEDAGLELRDMLMWLHGQGYPKTRNLTGEWDGLGHRPQTRLRADPARPPARRTG